MGEVDRMSVRFTVCIPVRNSLKTLPRCLESVRSQDFSDYEIVMVDNGSDEKTIHYLKGVEGDRIRIVYQENEGLYLSRKKAMEKAKGDYLFFLDSDDYLEQGILAKLSAVIDRTQADVLFLTTSLIGFNREKQIPYPFPAECKNGILSGNDSGFPLGTAFQQSLEQGYPKRSAERKVCVSPHLRGGYAVSSRTAGKTFFPLSIASICIIFTRFIAAAPFRRITRISSRNLKSS